MRRVALTAAGPRILTGAVLGLVGSFSATATCAQTAAPPSPEAVVRAYTRALAADNLQEFWRYASTYTFEVETATMALPKTMWGSKTVAIQDAWRTKISNDRSSGEVYTSTRCWNLFRPGTAVEVIETRREFSDAAMATWRAFVKVTFASREWAPLYVIPGPGMRRLREATVLMELTNVSALRRFLVSDACMLVDGTVAFWPAPDLLRERALELAKSATASFGPHARLELAISVPAPAQEVLSGQPIRAVEQLKAAFARHGIRVTPEGRQGLNLGVPANWSRFQLADGTYLLSESESAEFTEFVVFREDARIAFLRLSYPGCSPICALLRDINGLGFAHFVFKNAPSGEWPTEVTRQVSLLWDEQDGWKVTAVQ